MGTSLYHPNEVKQPLKSAVVNISTATTTAIVAAVTGQSIRMYRILLVAGGTVNVTFKDGSTALTGAMPLVANEGFVLDYQTQAWFVTSSGAALNLTTDANVNLTGTVWYLVQQL